MRDLLSKLIGKEVDVLCTGTSSLRGTITKIDGDVLHLKDDEDNSATSPSTRSPPSGKSATRFVIPGLSRRARLSGQLNKKAAADNRCGLLSLGVSSLRLVVLFEGQRRNRFHGRGLRFRGGRRQRFNPARGGNHQCVTASNH
jgi:hypothetical protein